MQRLIRYACGLGYTGPETAMAGVTEALDAVQDLCANILAGDIDWTLGPEATDDQVIGALCRKLHGMRSNQRRHEAVLRREGVEALATLTDDSPDAEEGVFWTSGLSARRKALEGDTEAQELLEAYCQRDIEREAAVKRLGWTAQKVHRVRQRMMWRLHAEGFKTTNDSEDGPPSSGPRGCQDEPQATEERQGAAREPARSAQHAQRRR